MNPTAIYSKTGKGVQEASGKTSNLSRADRAVLSAIDGKSNVGALYNKFEKTPRPRFDQLIERLEREGYIREASPGVTSAPRASRPSAPPASKPMDVVSDLDFTGVFTPVAPAASGPSSVPKAPTVDLAAKARAEAERRAQEESLSYKARQAAEAKAKAEAEVKAKADAGSIRSREEAEARERAEAEARLREAQQIALRVAAEEKARADKARAEAEAKEKVEAEARKRQEEEERKLALRVAAEEKAKADKLRAEAEAKEKAEAEARRRKEEEARKRREEEERKRKEDEERKRREEEEARRRKEEEERRRKEEEERKRKEEEERKRREEEEARRRKQEEEARRRKEEEERRRREEDEARKRREEEQAQKLREEQEAQKRRKEQQEAELRRQEEEARAAAPTGEKFADSLLADLDNFAERDEAESKAKEETARKEKEQTERARREQQARAQREEEERKRREEEDRARRERERRARELEEAEARNAVDAASDSRAKRRLAAIVAADVVGYSRLMGIDEEGTLTRFRRLMRELIQRKVDEHGGRIVKTAGDGMLIEFPSVVDAVRFAVEVQTAVANEEAEIATTRQIAFRMGINLGDIIGEDNDVYGDGVNVAARLEGLADRGGICIAGVVYDQIRDKVTYSIEDLGEQKLKNIPRPVRAYKIKGDWETAKLRRSVEPGSLPHRQAAAPAREVDEDVVVRDEDLDMDEVRRDEQALTKEALKAQREREREARRRKKAADADIGPIRIRRRRKWGKPIAVTLLLALIAGVGAVHVVPVDTGAYAKAASAALGRKVTIGAARMSLVNGPEMKFERVRIGDIVVETVRVFPTLGSLFSDRKVLGRVELIGALVPENELGDTLLGTVKSPKYSIARVEAKQLRLRGPLALPAFDADAVLNPNGALKSLTLSGPDKLEVKIAPQDGTLAIEGSAASLTLPIANQVTLTDFSLKGTATREGLTLSDWEGTLLDGIVSGTAQISWGPTWRAQGSLKVKGVNAAVFAPALLSDGKANGSGSFLMQGADPGKLGAGARIDGGFTVSKGMLGSFDLSRSIRTAGKESQGTTLFAELSAKGSYDKGAVELRDVNIAAGALNAGAIVDIAPSGHLSGRIVADVRTAGQTLRSTINLAGTVKQPEVKK
ncbi:MAG: adenylate/guanylate cyclase domain-containing protein [Burkholderiales bacterium]